MKRKISKDEVQRFFESVNKQFEEAGFLIEDMHFVRTKRGNLKQIMIDYKEVHRDFWNIKKANTDGK